MVSTFWWANSGLWDRCHCLVSTPFAPLPWPPNLHVPGYASLTHQFTKTAEKQSYMYPIGNLRLHNPFDLKVSGLDSLLYISALLIKEFVFIAIHKCSANQGLLWNQIKLMKIKWNVHFDKTRKLGHPEKRFLEEEIQQSWYYADSGKWIKISHQNWTMTFLSGSFSEVAKVVNSVMVVYPSIQMN